jgi:serine/threonine protein phosphatase PrpC
MSGKGGPTQFAVAWGAATDRGRRRAANEDALLAMPPIFVVADGMGGHVAGAAAAQAVVEAFAREANTEWYTPAALDRAVGHAAAQVLALGHPDGPSPGSTVTGVGLACADGVPCWLVFNIGDSRTYRLADGELEQVTVDHSVVQQLIDAGELAHTDARTHLERNVITRALGAGLAARPVVDQWLVPAAPGDRLLVCSDGLHGEVTDQLIAATLLAAPEPDTAARNLIEAALAAGGRDNVSAVVIDALTVVPDRAWVAPPSLDEPTIPRAVLRSPDGPGERG